jgi:cell division protein FtsL
MNQRKLKPWMRHERVFIWTTTIVTFLLVAGAITYRAIL